MEQNAMKQTGKAQVPVYRTYKDRVFRMLFKEKKPLLELYNALNGTAYKKEEELTVNTLENVIYMKMKNDVSLIIGCDMCLYEHQSSYCPNMPLRGFLYFADLYKKYLGNTELSTRQRIMLPTPRYIVFYNGLERKEEEFTQYLSESFEGNDGCIELAVKTLNINYGYNKELLGKCPTLNGYARFVSMVRENLKDLDLREAVEKTVEECIRQSILKDFFMEQKSEVIAMSIYEYNEEYAMRVTFEQGEEKNFVQNIESIMKNLNVSLEQACKILDSSVEKYRQAKKDILAVFEDI